MIADPGHDEDNEDEEDLEDPEDAGEGAEVVRPAAHGPGEVARGGGGPRAGGLGHRHVVRRLGHTLRLGRHPDIDRANVVGVLLKYFSHVVKIFLHVISNVSVDDVTWRLWGKLYDCPS